MFYIAYFELHNRCHQNLAFRKHFSNFYLEATFCVKLDGSFVCESFTKHKELAVLVVNLLATGNLLHSI